MNLAALTHVTSGAAFALLLASACGGNSFSRGGDGPQAGAGIGGSDNTAGSTKGGSDSSSGGTSSGGASSGGTSSAGSGSGGDAPAGEACNAPPTTGDCAGRQERWYHEPSTGLCRPFVHSGCGGNANNHETFEACQQACPGGTPNYDACSVASDCALTGTSNDCCTLCDGPDLRARDLVAINKKHLLQCLRIALPACPSSCVPQGNNGTLRYFVPNCVQGQCVAEDIRTSSVSACATDMDCQLRSGNDCCSSCGGEPETIAINSSGAFEKLVCGDTPPGCPECAPTPVSGAARCGDGGHCEVVYPVPL